MPERDAHRALDGHLLLLDQDLAQQPAVDPLHDHVDPVAIFVVIDLHHRRVIELFADGFFALEAVEKQRIGFDFGMRNFEGYHAARIHVRGAINGGHSAAGDKIFDAVMVELIAGME